jgi:3-phenylpropionate/trans-cinnamate dioxygenase ferredoxin reductase subunit
LRFRAEKYYDDQAIELVHGCAESIERESKRVRLRDGRELNYDHLILAVGGRNRQLQIPGADLSGVLGLKTLADADSLAAFLPEVRNVVVVGAGFIGLEFAAVASARGVKVHVLELADRPMARAVSSETGEFFGRAHAGWGVKLHYGTGIEKIHGHEGRVAGVDTTDGQSLAADLVVVGIGIVPNVELAAEAGLEVSNGICVDSLLATSDPFISAIGDNVSFPSSRAGARLRLESVQNAVDQARCVASRLVGKPFEYAAVPWFWSEQGDLKLQIAGLLSGYDRTKVVGDMEKRSFSVLCFKEDRLVAVESVNRPADHLAAKRILAVTRGLTPAEITDANFELKDVA